MSTDQHSSDSNSGKHVVEGGDAYGANGSSIKSERPMMGALEVAVETGVERAMKVLKRKLIKEGLFKELKSRRFYEKPSDRKKRKDKESVKKVRKEEARAKKNQLLF